MAVVSSCPPFWAKSRRQAHPLHHGCASLRRGPPPPNETLGEDAAAAYGPCVSPLASSPTRFAWGRGTIAPRDGGRGDVRRYTPGTWVTGVRPQPIFAACRRRKHVPCPNVIVWRIWWSIMARRPPRSRASSACRARAHTSGCRASARADARRTTTGAGLASRGHSGQLPRADLPVLAVRGETHPGCERA